MLTHTKFQDVDTIICRYVQRKTPDLGHTSIRTTDGAYSKIFAGPSKNIGRNRKKGKNDNCKDFCVTSKGKKNCTLTSLVNLTEILFAFIICRDIIILLLR